MFQNKNIYLALNRTFCTEQSAGVCQVEIQKTVNFDSIQAVSPFAIFQLPNQNPKVHTMICIPLKTVIKPGYVSLCIKNEAWKTPYGTNLKRPSVQTQGILNTHSSCIDLC